MMPNLIAKDPPRCDVVAITESAGQTQNLVFTWQSRIFQQLIDVHQIGPAAGQLKGMDRLVVTVGTRSSDDQDAGIVV